jgi:UDP-N-acetylmuramate: L-alanyl-gamma-D-glutamyl-meso-diaminopimelate ligase
MHIHIIGIAGNLTHNLGLCLKSLWHCVTGSDTNFDEPMKSRLEAQDFCTDPGYDADRIHTGLDLIIMPMSMMLDNPEYLRAKELWLPIKSFAEFIYEMSRDKRRIVIAGSHGKTTTTSMIMRVLKYHQKSFDWLVGSQVPGFDAMVGLSDAPYIIIEWDEYPDNKINLQPKFLQYHHHVGILNGIDRDHINIFQTMESYMDCFRSFVAATPEDGKLYYTITDPKVVEVIKSVPWIPKQAYFPQRAMIDPDGKTIALDEIDRTFPLEIFGEHNMVNLAAAKAICMDEFGLTEKEVLTALQSFPGSYIRMQCVHESDALKMYRDFAHSPSKLKAATHAIKQKFPSSHIIWVFELGTISANNAEFLENFAHSFDEVDTAVVFQNPAKKTGVSGQYIHGWFAPIESAEQVQNGFAREDIEFICDKPVLLAYLKSSILHFESCIMLLMSNSNFDNLDIESLI